MSNTPTERGGTIYYQIEPIILFSNSRQSLMSSQMKEYKNIFEGTNYLTLICTTIFSTIFIISRNE